MSERKVDLILHPIRFRILQTFTGEPLTTQEIADLLPDVPKSSLYRHLKSLLKGEMITVAETNLVHGIQEKRYVLAQRPYLSVDDMADVTAEEHLRYFTVYILNQVRGFADYLEAAEAKGGPIDMLADRVGYQEAVFYATDEELLALGQAINEAYLKVADNKPGDGRRKHKLATIFHPVMTPGETEAAQDEE